MIGMLPLTFVNPDDYDVVDPRDRVWFSLFIIILLYIYIYVIIVIFVHNCS